MFKIVWTPEAESTYYETLQYWIEHNNSNVFSLKLITEIELTEEELKRHPLVGQRVEGFPENIRRVIVLNNFSLFYRVNESVIEILSFWDNRRNPENLNL